MTRPARPAEVATLPDLLARLALLEHAERLANSGGYALDVVRAASDRDLSVDKRKQLFARFRATDDEAERARLAAALLFGRSYAVATGRALVTA